MSIHADALPLRRAAIAVRPGKAVARSPSGGLLFSNVPDSANQERTIVAIWSGASAALGDVVWQHYRDHSTGPFNVTLPTTGEVVPVTYSNPPSTAWASPTTVASVTVELEESLAHE